MASARGILNIQSLNELTSRIWLITDQITRTETALHCCYASLDIRNYLQFAVASSTRIGVQHGAGIAPHRAEASASGHRLASSSL